MENDWIEWSGGDCPVSEDTHVEVRMRSTFIKDGVAVHRGFKTKRPTEFHHWDDTGEETDIIAYRIIPAMFPN